MGETCILHNNVRLPLTNRLQKIRKKEKRGIEPLEH
jgi:hypothetical protein